MHTTAIHRHRSLLPTINLAIAACAAVLAVIAIASDDVTSTTPPKMAPVVTVAGPAHPLGGATLGIPCDELIYTRC